MYGWSRGLNLKTVFGKNIEMKRQNRIINHLEDCLIIMATPVWFMTMRLNLFNCFECSNKGKEKRKSVDIMYLVF